MAQKDGGLLGGIVGHDNAGAFIDHAFGFVGSLTTPLDFANNVVDSVENVFETGFETQEAVATTVAQEAGESARVAAREAGQATVAAAKALPDALVKFQTGVGLIAVIGLSAGAFVAYQAGLIPNVELVKQIKKWAR